ncbi:MAG: hypothetical protein RIC15_05320 [Vicingaceae bacterium]
MNIIKHLLFFLTLTLIQQSSFAQVQEFSQQDLEAYHDIKYTKSLRGTNALMAWSVLNLSTGLYGGITQEGTERYFFEMNALWGGINLLISGASYGALRRERNQPVFPLMAQTDQKKVERIYLINAGLDVLYITGGALLIDYSTRRPDNRERLNGYGQSIILQGSFLLVFDSVMYLIHRNNGLKRLQPIIQNLSFTGSGLRYCFK